LAYKMSYYILFKGHREVFSNEYNSLKCVSNELSLAYECTPK